MRDDTSTTGREAPSPAPLPTWARRLDLAAVALLLSAFAVAFTGGYYGEPFGMRISARSPERIGLAAVLLILFRHWRIRHPTLWERFEEALHRAPESLGVNAPLAPDGVQLASHDSRARRWGLIPRPGRGELTFVSIFFAAVVAIATYPHIFRLDSVTDLGDPLFSTWRLAWIAHQLPRDPLHLFDANIFHPEPLTLTNSDAMVVPGLMAAPLLWLGMHPIYVSNLMQLGALVLSGVSMFVLVRGLTGRPEAGIVAGTLFALYPYRFEHYPHLELQITFWMPLLLLAVHRIFMHAERRDGILFGILVALQTLSSLYYGVFLLVYLVPVVAVMAIRADSPRLAARALGTGAVIAAVIVAPVAAAYIANRSLVGQRDAAEVAYYSALPQDYLKPHPRSRYYGVWDSGPRQVERELFPTLSPVVLTAVGMWPPLSAARIGYIGALVVSFEASRGTHGPLYRTLREYLPPFRGLRAPARFSIMVGLTLAILGGYGAARLTRSRHRTLRVLVTGGLVAIAFWEMSPRLELVPAWLAPPAIYDELANADEVVLAEFPAPDPQRPDDPRATYFSLFHWRKIVNGTSGHYPTSYIQLLARLRGFPDEMSFSILRERGVTHIAVHGGFYRAKQFQQLVRALDRRPEVELVKSAPFEGSESRLYRLVR